MITNVPTPTVGHAPALALTKREHFAAMAMQGLCSQSTLGDADSYIKLASAAVTQADTLIAVLNHRAES